MPPDRTKPVVFQQPDPAWPALFAAEAALLRDILGARLLDVQHIGSTSVPGLAAKPTIDLLGLVDRVEDLEPFRDALAAAGYAWMGENGLVRRRFFLKLPAGHATNFANLHIYAQGDPEGERHLAFRDFLRVHPEVTQAYAALKLDLATRHPFDREAYQEGKDAFIKHHERLALAERGSMHQEASSARIGLTNVTLGEEEAQAAAAVIRSGWVTMGAQVEGFEREFAAALDSPHAVAVTNGTVALHLAYRVAGLGAGDEFLLPGLTFVATANAGLQLGAIPVPVDIAGEDDLTLCPEDVMRKITRRTKLIVTMPYGGFCPAMHAICDLAAERRIPVVEDACHAPLARMDGQPIGSFGRMATYSFFGNKNLTTGEGGMILAQSAEDARRLRLLRAHGMTATTWDRERGHASDYDVLEPGFNYRLDEIRAAVGREQLKKLPAATAARSAAAANLRTAIEALKIPGLQIPFAAPRGVSAHHLFVVLLPAGSDRPAVRRALLEHGVQSSIHYPPLHTLSHLRSLASIPTPRLDAIAPRLLTLPLGPGLRADQIAAIAAHLREALAAP